MAQAHTADELGTRDTVSPPPPALAGQEGAEGGADPADPLLGTVLADRYRITRLLGAGGMGAVYRAEHVHMRKAFALKVLHREMTVLPEIVARFEREAIAAGRIEHPNVAAATDFGRLADGAFYLVLEFIEGRSLSKALSAEGPFSPLRAVHIARQVAEALAAAHAAGVVHRDLKPDNVMLVEREGDPDFVKVLDFGIAKVRTDDMSDGQQALTRAGSVFGTPEYMSPEQAKGEPVDARSDLYTLGMILYEMLAGRTAFASEELIAILTKHLTEEPPPLPKEVPSALRDLVMRLLRKDPSERIQTASELAALLSAMELEWGPRRLPSLVEGDVRFDARGTAPGLSRWVTTGSRSLADAWERTSPVRQRVSGALKYRVRLAGKAVPLWALAVPVTLLSMVMTLALARSSGDGEETPSLADHARRLATAVLDPELPRLIDRAKTGDREALADLRKRAEQDGSADQWMALGRGYAEIAHRVASVEAYGRALGYDAGLAKNRQLLIDLREAAESTDSYEKAMDMALEALGELGADLIEAVHREGKGKPGMEAIVAHAKKLMAEERFREVASPALRVALELESAKLCSDYKELIPRAAEHGDERSLRKLKALNVTRGCGFLGLKDCYSCLRSKDVDLAGAIEAVEKRPAPSLPSREEKKSASGEGASKR